MRRWRQILVAEYRNNLVGLALAYRGPVGLNFSFLENRCDLITANSITETERRDVYSLLINKISKFYNESELLRIMVTTDASAAYLLGQLGGKKYEITLNAFG